MTCSNYLSHACSYGGECLEMAKVEKLGIAISGSALGTG